MSSQFKWKEDFDQWHDLMINGRRALFITLEQPSINQWVMMIGTNQASNNIREYNYYRFTAGSLAEAKAHVEALMVEWVLEGKYEI